MEDKIMSFEIPPKYSVSKGMTPDDVKNSNAASELQKKYADAFDIDGKKVI